MINISEWHSRISQSVDAKPSRTSGFAPEIRIGPENVNLSQKCIFLPQSLDSKSQTSWEEVNMESEWIRYRNWDSSPVAIPCNCSSRWSWRIWRMSQGNSKDDFSWASFRWCGSHRLDNFFTAKFFCKNRFLRITSRSEVNCNNSYTCERILRAESGESLSQTE
jgi:hypothetical protein